MTYAARLILWLFRGSSPWDETCSHCKGYPQVFCSCSRRVKLRRWARKHL